MILLGIDCFSEKERNLGQEGKESQQGNITNLLAAYEKVLASHDDVLGGSGYRHL
jgi:hypothetical protein